MKKLTIIFLILLGATAYIHAQNNQPSSIQFKKIFIPDMYQMSKHIYSGTKPRYESNQGNYTNMKLAGITHLFGLADQIPLSNISNTGSTLKILDRRVSENKPGTNQPYEASLYMFGLGVSPEDHPYRVGGQAVALHAEDDYLWGFGQNNRRSIWALTSVDGQALVGGVATDLNQQTYRTCPADAFGNMAAIKNDPDHFLLHTTGGPHLTINDPIRYYIGITGSIANHTHLPDDEIVLELHVYTELQPGRPVDAGRYSESSGSQPDDTCAATVIYIRKQHLAGSGWKHYVSLDSYIRHVVDKDEKGWKFHIRANKVGSCVVNIRDLFIVDQFYYASVYPNLFRENFRAQIASSIENELIPDALKGLAAYEGIYLEEPKTLMNRSIRIVDSIAYLMQQRNVAAMDWHRNRYQWEMMRYDWPRKSLDVDGYFLTDAVSPESNNNPNSIQAAINARIKTVLTDVDNTYNGLRANIEAANGYGGLYDPIPYINYIQIGEERDYEDGRDRYGNRTVSSQEIQMQGWLSLCFGAKGIGYYPGAEREDTYYDDDGLLQGVRWQGMFKSNTSGTEMIIDTERYNAVKKLNAEIDSIAPVYMQLIWKNSYNTIGSGNQTEYYSLINESPFSSVSAQGIDADQPDHVNLRFVQVSFFDHKTETGPGTYFIVMNRRVLSSESRYIKMTFDNLNTAFSTNYANWKITDVKKDTSYTIPASGGVYTFLCPPGEGKLFKLEPVVKSGYGRIKYNETINEVLTVPSGKTLVIASEPYISNSITLNFGNAGRFISNGSLIINGSALDSVSIVFDPSAKATYNTGIRLTSGSATINCAKIYNASYGVRVMNNARLTMYGSRLFYNYAGVLIDGTAYFETPASTIEDCRLHDNEQGVHFYNGTGRLKMNRIMQNYQGVFANSGSYAYLFLTDDSGINKITQNEEGVSLYDNSTIIVGNANSEYNYNTLDLNTFDLWVYNNSTVEAEYVWWGDAIPNREVYADQTSKISVDPYLMSEPPEAAITDPRGNDPGYLSDGSVLKTTDIQASDDITTKMGFEPVLPNTPIEGSNLNKLLNDAKKYFRTGNYYAGAEICKAIIDSNKNDKTSVSALSLLADESRVGYGSEFRSYISQLTRVPGTTKIDSYVGLIDAKLDPKKYESKIDSLILKYNKKDELLMYLYDKFVHCLLNKEKPDQAIAVYAEMVQRFPDSKQTQIAYRMLNPAQFSVSQNLMSTENTQIPKEYGISNNYPNPFNPETSIDYAIPYPSNVVIELYGVTGEKVRTLVQNDHTPGYYTYRLTNTSGMASGIYFYRIAATNLQTGNVYTTVRKMTLMK